MAEIISKWFWAVFLVVAGINVVIVRYRAREDMAVHPEKWESLFSVNSRLRVLDEHALGSRRGHHPRWRC